MLPPACRCGLQYEGGAEGPCGRRSRNLQARARLVEELRRGDLAGAKRDVLAPGHFSTPSDGSGLFDKILYPAFASGRRRWRDALQAAATALADDPEQAWHLQQGVDARLGMACWPAGSCGRDEYLHQPMYLHVHRGDLRPDPGGGARTARGDRADAAISPVPRLDGHPAVSGLATFTSPPSGALGCTGAWRRSARRPNPRSSFVANSWDPLAERWLAGDGWAMAAAGQRRRRARHWRGLLRSGAAALPQDQQPALACAAVQAYFRA